MAHKFPQPITEEQVVTIQTGWRIKCEQCGEIREVPFAPGRVPRFCTNACKQRAKRERAKAGSSVQP